MEDTIEELKRLASRYEELMGRRLVLMNEDISAVEQLDEEIDEVLQSTMDAAGELIGGDN